MKSGESIRSSFKLYTANPIVILPYLLFGIFNLILSFFAVSHFRDTLATIRFTSSIEFLILGQTLTSALSSIFLKSFLFLAAIGIIFLIVDALVKSYTIGLSAAIVRGKKATLSDGLAATAKTFTIVGKNIVIGILLVLGAALVFMTSVVLLGKFALISFIPATIIYLFILFAITLFSSQSIVLENKNAWQGIASSYFFMKKHMEDVAKLVLFLIFVFVAFQMIKLSATRLLAHYFAPFAMQFVSLGASLLLGYLIMRPYFVILKTHFFLNNLKPSKKS